MTAQTVVSLAVPVKERRTRHKSSTKTGFLHPAMINVISQSRDIYPQDAIDSKVMSIPVIGLLQPPLVAELDKTEIDNYLAAFNAAYGTFVAAQDLVTDFKTGHYFIVVFGHCRKLACDVIWRDGCFDCRESYGEDNSANGSCVRRHELLNTKGMLTTIVRSLDPQKALDMQEAENDHTPISQERLAFNLQRKWELARARNPGISKTQFAAKVSRSVSVISAALRYCELPQRVRDKVTEGVITYTTAEQLGRLQTAGIPDDMIADIYLNKCLAGATPVELRKIINGAISTHKMGQIELEDLMSGMSETDFHNSQLAQVVTARAVRYFETEGDILYQAVDLLPEGTDLLSDPRLSRVYESGTAVRSKLIAASVPTGSDQLLL